MVEVESANTNREIVVKIQRNGYPVITKTCEISADEAERIGRLFLVIRDNMSQSQQVFATEEF